VSDRVGGIVTRATLAGVALGVVLLVVLPRRGAWGWDIVDAVSMGLCFAFVGEAADAALRAIPGIDTPGGRVVRVAGWFAAGLWAALMGRVLWRLYGRETADLPGLVWGGVVLVALELVQQAGLRWRGSAAPLGRAKS
jgi:hypothetical protein